MKLLSPGYPHVVDEICRFRWSKINRNELLAVCRAYYYFSRQFCETLEIACRRHPLDHQLAELWNAECNTDILSPYPGLAAPGERMSHDEFMRRILAISSLDRDARARVDRLGTEYLADIRRVDAFSAQSFLPRTGTNHPFWHFGISLSATSTSTAIRTQDTACSAGI
jgi:hypothetical protein